MVWAKKEKEPYSRCPELGRRRRGSAVKTVRPIGEKGDTDQGGKE